MFQSKNNESHIQHNTAEESVLGSPSNHFATARYREPLKFPVFGIPATKLPIQNPADRSIVDHDILEA